MQRKNAHRCKELTPVLGIYSWSYRRLVECMHRLRDIVFGVPADDDPTPDCTLGAGSHSLKGLRSMLSVTYHDLSFGSQRAPRALASSFCSNGQLSAIFVP